MANLLVPMKTYLEHNTRIGLKNKSKDMSRFIYRVRSNGLAILDINKIDKRLRTAANFLAKFEPQEVFVVGRREESVKPVDKFAEVTGVKKMTGRYHPGILTNPSYRHYFEPSVLLTSDPWADKQAIRDALRSNIPIVSLLNTNDTLESIDLAIPCNNREEKSLSLVYYILAREYLKRKEKIEGEEEFDYEIEDFTSRKEKNKS